MSFTKVKTIYFCSVILLLAKLTNSLSLHFKEGHHGEVIFQYPGKCDTENIILVIGGNPPFYLGGEISPLGLSSSQQERFDVQFKEDGTNDGGYTCLTHVSIRSVERRDAGTYHFLKTNDATILYRSKIILSVIYSPGKAICMNITSHGVMSLRCAAKRGYYVGKFECYQNGNILPSLSKPDINGSHFTQIITIEAPCPVKCCSSLYYEHKGVNDCNATVWDPGFGNEFIGKECSTGITSSPQISTAHSKVDESGLQATSTSLNQPSKKQLILYSIFLTLITAGIILVAVWHIYKTKPERPKKAKRNESNRSALGQNKTDDL